MESMNEEKELLEHVMKLMAEHFGKNCEIVLHDFMAPDNHTIIGIENGEVTGREIGGCVTNLGLEILNGKPAEDAFNYATYAENGHLLRSSSIYFHNSAGQPIGSLCINTDITDTTYFEKMLREYNNTHDYENREDASPKEVFMPDVHELLNRLIDQCIQKYGKPPKLLTKEEKIQFIADLDMKGAFVITKASDLAAWDFPIHILYISGAGEENAWGKPDSCRIKCLSKRHIFCLDIERIIVLKYNQT